MSAVLRTIVFTIVAPGFWTVLLPYWVVGRAHRGAFPSSLIATVFGLLLMGLGFSLYLLCAFWGFALRGRGTPAPIDPPKKLVVEGPYRMVRNPMYWSVFLVMAGEALLFRSVTLAEWAAVFFVGTMLFVWLYEEPTLRRKFGAEYEEYCRAVGRWLPRLKRS
jgi:protein-S-isoprenylcysteine O-methyltransferase Ste14